VSEIVRPRSDDSGREAEQSHSKKVCRTAIATCVHPINQPQNLERQVQGHLQETRAADGVLDDTELPVGRANIGRLEANPRSLRDAGRLTGADVVGRIRKERIELDVVVRRIEAGMIEDVEGLQIETQLEALGDLEILEQAHVDARLKRAHEDIAAGRTKAGFVDIAGARSGVAWRNAKRGIAGLE